MRTLLEGAHFSKVEVTLRPFEVHFPRWDTYIENSVHANAVVVPRFAEDRAAFNEYLHAVSAEAQPLLEEYIVAGGLTVSTPTQVALAHA